LDGPKQKQRHQDFRVGLLHTTYRLIQVPLCSFSCILKRSYQRLICEFLTRNYARRLLELVPKDKGRDGVSKKLIVDGANGIGGVKLQQIKTDI
jgi:hypothetical protein